MIPHEILKQIYFIESKSFSYEFSLVGKIIQLYEDAVPVDQDTDRPKGNPEKEKGRRFEILSAKVREGRIIIYTFIHIYII